MTSQISIRKLLKQEIRQNGWMFGLTGLMHLLTGPVVFLLNTSRYANWTDDTASHRYHDFFTDTFFIWQLLTMLGCLTIGIFVYRYLFSRRMVDLYHSVPISRSRLFLTKYLHGFLIWFIPFVLNAGSILLFYMFRAMGKPYFLECLGILLKCVLLLIVCFFIFYHLFLAAVYLSGNVINMFANMAIIGASVIAIAMSLYSCAGNFFDTYCYTPSGLQLDILYSLSPLTAPFAIYNFLASDGLGSHMPLVIISILICLGLLDLSWILCLKRPSELAEKGTESKRYIMPARIAASILIGIAGGLFFSAISSEDQQLAWGIFGSLLSSVVTFGALNSIYRTTIKAFFRHKIQLVVTAAVSVLIMVSFQLDLFGYDAYLPAKEDIAGMAIYSNQFTDGSAYISETVTSSGPVLRSTPRANTGYVTQAELLTDTDLSYDLLESFVNGNPDGSYNNYYAKIQLKNGRTYERRYRLSYDQYEKLKPFVESESYIAANYKYSTGAFGYPQELTLEFLNTSVNIDPTNNALAEPIIKELMDAYRTDFDEHFSLESESSRLNVFSFSGGYTRNDEYFWFTLDVPMEYERTLAVLEKHYPEHQITVETEEDVTQLYLNTNFYETFVDNGYTLDALYEHFGYQKEASDTEASDAASSHEQPAGEEETSDVEVIELATADGKPIPATIAAAESYAELLITDEEVLSDLYPLLYFGQYRDMFHQREFIFVGDVRTQKGDSVNCYVKPGTMPKEIIAQLYEAREEYEY